MFEKIESIQAARAIAAWSVVMGHISGRVRQIGMDEPIFVALNQQLGLLAHLGVDLFFVISGAIMFMLYGRARERTGAPAAADFCIRRLFRIYPLFWVTAVATPLAGFGTAPGSVGELVSGALLLSVPSFHLVAWTLVYEVHFYLLVCLTILLCGRYREAGFALLCVGWLLVIFAVPRSVFSYPFFVYPMVAEFIFGMAVAAAFRWRLLPASLTLGIGIIWLCAGWTIALDANINDVRLWAFGAPMALLLYGTICLERDGAFRIPRWLHRAGDESYSVYLWHFAVLFTLQPLFMSQSGPASAFCYAPVALAATWVTARLSYLICELPLQRMAREMSDKLITKNLGLNADKPALEAMNVISKPTP